MLDVGWTELLVIGALALIVVGPRDLPQLLNQVGRWVGQIKRMAREFQRSLEEAARDSDLGNLKDLRDLKKDIGSLDFRQQAAKAQSYLKQPVKVEPTAGAKPAQLAATPEAGAAASGSAASGSAASGAVQAKGAGGNSDDAMPGVAVTPPPAGAPEPEEHGSPGTKVSEG